MERFQKVDIIDRKIRNYARRWERRDEFGDIVAIVAKALLSGRVRIAISYTKKSGGKHKGDAASTYHSYFSKNHSQNNGRSVTYLVEQTPRMHVEQSSLGLPFDYIQK